MKEFVIWYLKRKCYDKTASIVEKSIEIENEKISKKQIQKFKKILKKIEEKDWFTIYSLSV